MLCSDKSLKGVSYGFLLVEAMISLLVIALFITLIFTMFDSSEKALQSTGDLVQAAFLGRSLLEEARGASFASITPTSGSRTFSGLDNNAPASHVISYNVSVASLNSNEKLVWATMNWKEPAGNQRLVMETLVVYQP